MNRRQFLTSSLLGSTALSASAGLLVASSGTTHALELTRVRVPIAGLPKNFSGYRIGFITDPHLGDCVSTDLLASALDLLRGQTPDLLLLGGDYILHTDSRFSQTMLSAISARSCFEFNYDNAEQYFVSFANLVAPHAPHDGIFGVLGNHDRSSDGRLCTRSFASKGIRILVNERVSIKRAEHTLELIGFDDLWTGVPRNISFSESQDQTALRVVLTHNPDLFTRLIDDWHSPFQLGFAGHTHGGQIKLPVVGALSYNVRDLRFKEGLVQLGGRHTFTSRGIGTVVLPLRLNCPPEVVLAELVEG